MVFLELQILLNGLVLGLALAVLSLSYSMVYLPCRVFHVTMGGIYALVPYIAFSMLRYNWSWVHAIFISIGTGVTVSLLCEFLNHARLVRKNASDGAHLIASLGVFIALTEVDPIIWGNQTQVLRSGIDRVYSFGPLVLTQAQMIYGIVSGVFLAIIYAWLSFTDFGLRLRALADNLIEFSLRGYNVSTYRNAGSCCIVAYSL